MVNYEYANRLHNKFFHLWSVTKRVASDGRWEGLGISARILSLACGCLLALLYLLSAFLAGFSLGFGFKQTLIPPPT